MVVVWFGLVWFGLVWTTVSHRRGGLVIKLARGRLGGATDRLPPLAPTLHQHPRPTVTSAPKAVQDNGQPHPYITIVMYGPPASNIKPRRWGSSHNRSPVLPQPRLDEEEVRCA